MRIAISHVAGWLVLVLSAPRTELLPDQGPAARLEIDEIVSRCSRERRASALWWL